MSAPDRRVGGSRLVGRVYLLGPHRVRVLTGWGPGAAIRNVRLEWLDGPRAGEQTIRPFRGLRTAPD